MEELQTNEGGVVTSGAGAPVEAQCYTTDSRSDSEQPSRVVSLNNRTSTSPFSRVILTDWLTFPGLGEAPRPEILEFAWAVYDVNSECVLEKVRHILRPTENDRTLIPFEFLKCVKMTDSRPLEHAKTLKQVLIEFDSACSMVAPPSVCVVIGSAKLRDQLLTETFRKALPVPKCLRGVLDLATLASHFYPTQLVHVPPEDLMSPKKVAQCLGAVFPPRTEEEFASMDGCILMSQIIKKMHVDSIDFHPQHLSTVVTAPELVTTAPLPLQQQQTTIATRTTTSTMTPTVPNPSSGTTPSATGTEFVVRMRGVPWDVSEGDIIQFVKPVAQITPEDIHISTNFEGRATGEVYVRLPTMAARDKCLSDLHGQHLGRRWVEVFKAVEGEFTSFASLKESLQLDKRGALRLRGLPYSTNEYEIVKFFAEGGFQVDINSVVLGQSRENRLSGEAWALLENPQTAEDARRVLHRKTIGRRYIELFQSSPREVEMARRGHLPVRIGGGAYERAAPYTPHHHPPPQPATGPAAWAAAGRFGGAPPPTVLPYHSSLPPPRDARSTCGNSSPYSTVLRLRGLPYYANENNIVEFFHGFGMATILPATAPVDGRPSGEAYVEFVSPEEAWRALKNRQGGMMDRRYIELFPATKEEMELAAAGMDPREIRSRYPRA